MCVDFCCTFVLPLISLVFTLFNLVTDWMSFFQYVSAPSNLLEFNLVTAVVYCVLGCLTGTINLILEVRLFRERILERRANYYGSQHPHSKVIGNLRKNTLSGPEKYLSFILPLLLSIILLQDIPSVIINSVFINYCGNVEMQPCPSPIPYFPCSILGYNIPPQGMPLVQFLTLASSIISLVGTSIRLFFAPIYICHGACGCCRRCCNGDDDGDDDDDYDDEDAIKCCCTQNLCAKIFFVILSFLVCLLGIAAAAVALNVNFLDSSLILGQRDADRPGEQWHVSPGSSNETLTFSGSQDFLDDGSRRNIHFSLNADLKQLVSYGSGGLFITYKAKCKDILYRGVPKSITSTDRRVDHIWQSNAQTWCYAGFGMKKSKPTRRQPTERLREANCTGSPVWNEQGDCNTLFRVLFDRKRSPPISYSAVPIDSYGQVRNDGGNPFSDACAVNNFWRRNTLKATFIASCRRRRLDCNWLRRHLASFLPASWIDFISSLLPFCPRAMDYNQRPDSCLLVDADARSRYQHVTIELHHPSYGK